MDNVFKRIVARTGAWFGVSQALQAQAAVSHRDAYRGYKGIYECSMYIFASAPCNKNTGAAKSKRAATKRRNKLKRPAASR